MDISQDMNTTTNPATATNINLGKVRDNSFQYAAGSFEIRVKFTMFGLAFEADKFVRTDKGGPCDSIHLFIRHDSCWMSDFVKCVDNLHPTNHCPVTREAARLIEVALAMAIDDGASERYAQIELA